MLKLRIFFMQLTNFTRKLCAAHGLNLCLLVVVAVCVSLHAVSENYEHTCEHQVWGDKYCMYGGTSKSYRKKELQVCDMWSEITRLEMRTMMEKWRKMEKQRELMGKTGEIDVG